MLMTNLFLLLNNVIIFTFIFSCLYTLRHLFFFGYSIKDGVKYNIKQKEILYLGLCLSFITTLIISGFKLF
jgi:hypothetical protein